MIWVATLGLSTYVGFVTEMQSRWRLDLAVEIASRLLLRAHTTNNKHSNTQCSSDSADTVQPEISVQLLVW